MCMYVLWERKAENRNENTYECTKESGNRWNEHLLWFIILVALKEFLKNILIVACHSGGDFKFCFILSPVKLYRFEVKIQKPNPYSVSALQDNHGIGQRRRKELNDERILVMQTSAYYAHIFADILNSGSQPIMVLTDLHQEATREKGQKEQNDCREQWQSTFLPPSFLSMYYQQGLTQEHTIRVINEVYLRKLTWPNSTSLARNGWIYRVSWNEREKL